MPSLHKSIKDILCEPSIPARTDLLVNPVSGLANDYLNHFNEAVMIIEQLPNMPDLMEDLLSWRPITYDDYFTLSNLPGREAAREAYAKLEVNFRRQFEDVVAELDHLATGCVVSIRRQLRNGDHDKLVTLCEKSAASLREVLKRASSIVNRGAHEADENAQRRADRLLAVRLKALKDLDDFFSQPRFSQD